MAAVEGAALLVTAACWLAAGDWDAAACVIGGVVCEAGAAAATAVSDGEASGDGFELAAAGAAPARLGLAIALGTEPRPELGTTLDMAGRALATTLGIGVG
ncbi:MAG TPA: hypothetical protein VHE14_00790 [Solirubrobacteraceae bacterium]|nr:hypothetical protein [Solirubrobacteraceae bacterium]